MKTVFKQFYVLMAAIAVIGIASCSNQATNNNDNAADSTQQALAQKVQPTTIEEAIECFLVDSLGSNYDKADLCVPECRIIATDDSNPDSIKVWGDFWVMNYNVAGDTLKTASGGNYPGMIQLRKTDEGYMVTGMDQVADGSDNTPSAKRIFGTFYEKYSATAANEKDREQARMASIARFANKQGLNVTCYQDFGWPAVPITPPAH